MKSLKRQEDVQSTHAAGEGGQSYFLSIPETRTPWFLMNLDYADGFVHWVDIGGQARRVVCAGGIDGKGFAPDTCPICSHVVGLYQEAKELREEGHTAKADKLKDKANRMRAKLEVQFKAIRGGYEIERDPKTKKKTKVVSFDVEDEDLNVAPGIIALSNSQFDGLTGLIKGEDTPFIEVGDDLGTHYLVTRKERKKGRTGGKYSQVVWDAEEVDAEVPDIEIPKELTEINLEDNFQVDDEALEKVYGLLTGEASEDADADEDVELEGDSVDEPDESYLDDVEGDEDEVEEDDDEEDDEEEGEDDEVLEFEDDMPDEEPPKKKKTSTSKGASAKPTAKRSTVKTSGKPVSRTTATKRKSGKTRL